MVVMMVVVYEILMVVIVVLQGCLWLSGDINSGGSGSGRDACGNIVKVGGGVVGW